MKNLALLLILLTTTGMLSAQKTGEISLKQNIENYSRLTGVTIFPNPVKDRLNIELDDYQNCLIYLYDINGKKVFKQKIEDDIQASFDISNLDTGTYLLFIINEQDKKSVNFRIQKL